MTGFDLQRLPFVSDQIRLWGAEDTKHRNWPVVYILNNDNEVYVGESLNAESRIHQHLDSVDKRKLEWVRIVLDDTFNKSVCLDLESFLIRTFAGDGGRRVLNRNAGITEADYFNRDAYRSTFDAVFERLRVDEKLFQRTLPEIINSDLFKLSPFKALNHDQAIAVEDIVEGLFADLESGDSSTVVVQGSPGTGKTVVAIYILKLLEDIRRHDPEEPFDDDSIFSDFFTAGHAEVLEGLRVGLVVPQQSLRQSIARVFALTPGLDKAMVLTPFDVGQAPKRFERGQIKKAFDLLIVDEAHRLNQRANQASGPLNKKFIEINEKLFGFDDAARTQLDWIHEQSEHVILMLDTGQSVRPADLPAETTRALLTAATQAGRVYPLRSQMRIAADQDYVGYVRQVLSDDPPSARQAFDGYDLRFFRNLREMREEIRRREEERGLARLVAGYAWPWRSKTDRRAFDLEIDGERMRWNSTHRDWINSANAIEEVGSIHTVQGYDLNYAGVIIGNDLRYDPVRSRIVFDRAEYHDRKGRQNNPKLGVTYSDDDILEYVLNIYVVLLTRGIRGTYVYVMDDPLREYLSRYF